MARSKQYGPVMVLGLRLGLEVGSNQGLRSGKLGVMHYVIGPGPRSNGLGGCTLYKYGQLVEF